MGAKYGGMTVLDGLTADTNVERGSEAGYIAVDMEFLPFFGGGLQ
jgi:hypothetical protein